MIKILIFIIKIYQYFVSPILGNRCRFLPTCSEYFIEALKTQGCIQGLKFGIIRILKCHPFKKLGGNEGVDFVPIPKKTNRQERLKRVVEGLQKAGWKLENEKESRNGQ